MIILVAGLFLVMGRAAVLIQVEALSLMLLIPGTVLLFYGWQYLKWLLVPIAYLQFMIPWIDPFLSHVQPYFQLISAEAATLLLKVAGIPVLKDGFYLHLPNVNVEVARECSGINFATSILALGFPMVYLCQRTYLGAAVVIFSGIAVTVAVNGLRVALACIMASVYGADMLHGPFHIFQGWFTAQVGVVAILLLNLAIMKVPTRSDLRLFERWKTRPHEVAELPIPINMARGLVVFCLLSVGLVLGLFLFANPKPVPLGSGFVQFPYSFGGWQGRDVSWYDSKRHFSVFDAKLSRVYEDNSGEEISLFVGYYEKQDHSKKLISHHLRELYEKASAVNLSSFAAPKKVNQCVLMTNGTYYQTIFWFWFPEGERIGYFSTRLTGMYSTILHRRNNCAVILIARTLQSRPGGDNSVRQSFNSFLEPMTPALYESLPIPDDGREFLGTSPLKNLFSTYALSLKAVFR